MRTLILLTIVVGLLVFMVPYVGAVDKPMVVYLSFDEPDPKVVKDHSPNQNKVTVSKGVKTADGKFGKALSFNGIQDFVEIPNNDSLNPTEEVTVEAWVYVEKQPAGTQWSALVGKNPYDVGYLMWFEDEDLWPRGLIWVGGTRYNVDSKVKLTEKRWYHSCYTVRQGWMDIYIDGVLTGTKSIPKGNFGTNANPLRVGGQGGGTGFNGIIDEVLLLNVALSQAQVSQMLAVSPSGKLATTWAIVKAR